MEEYNLLLNLHGEVLQSQIAKSAVLGFMIGFFMIMPINSVIFIFYFMLSNIEESYFHKFYKYNINYVLRLGMTRKSIYMNNLYYSIINVTSMTIASVLAILFKLLMGKQVYLDYMYSDMSLFSIIRIIIFTFGFFMLFSAISSIEGVIASKINKIESIIKLTVVFLYILFMLLLGRENTVSQFVFNNEKALCFFKTYITYGISIILFTLVYYFIKKLDFK